MIQEDAVPQIDWGRADLLIELALNEDLDTTGDVTTNSVVPEEAVATAVLRCQIGKSPQISQPYRRTSGGKHKSELTGKARLFLPFRKTKCEFHDSPVLCCLWDSVKITGMQRVARADS